MMRIKNVVSVIPLVLGLAAPLQARAACPAPLWEQVVENDESSGGSNYTAPSYYYTTTTGICDNDPDTDYVFVFKGNFYSCNPDGLRYTNGGYLNSDSLRILRRALTDDDVHVCMGDNTVNFWYGGVNNVWNSLRLYYR
ncbi:MAG TPA: hypothetical protein VFZ09_18650 [Archangium sp.]|uniref:hypothetical protein n=1 Tax=Archangium sp. TaxID=1872627 RepID=UPI002E35157C|nr:hypothetical protein [Archangium sp.]HEX5748266.1 hypothetical protein [Archangium sp.]